MNKLILIGRIANKFKLETVGSTKKLKFTVATDRYVAADKKDDDSVQKADFHPVTAWGKQAELIDQFMNVGSTFAGEARMASGRYQDKDGNTVYTYEATLDRFEFVGPRQTEAGAPAKVAKANPVKEVEKKADVPWELDL